MTLGRREERDLTLQIGDTLVHAGLGHRRGRSGRNRKSQGRTGKEGVFAYGFDDSRHLPLQYCCVSRHRGNRSPMTGMDAWLNTET